MRFTFRSWVISIVLAAGAFVPASATTIGFEGVATTAPVVPATPYTESGFKIVAGGLAPTFNGIFPAGLPGVNTDGSAIFGWCNERTLCQPIFGLTYGGGDFNISSIDASNLVPSAVAGSPIPPGLAIDLTGFKQGGGTVTQSRVLVQDTLTTYSLSGFSNLWGLEITTNIEGAGTNGDVAIDNLVVQGIPGVPEPATLALVLGGLGVTALRRRRSPKH